MIEELFENNKRTQRIQHIDTDLLVAGGGMAGVCAAIAAARQGLRVALVHDPCWAETHQAKCDYGCWAQHHIWATTTAGQEKVAC